MRVCGYIYGFYKNRRVFYEKNLKNMEIKINSKGEINSKMN